MGLLTMRKMSSTHVSANSWLHIWSFLHSFLQADFVIVQPQISWSREKDGKVLWENYGKTFMVRKPSAVCSRFSCLWYFIIYRN